MISRKLSLRLMVLVSFIVPTFLCVRLVYAGEGGSTGGGGNNGCEGLFSTCYGATWRWYATSSNSVHIDGAPSNQPSRAYVAATDITGCAEYGGYWRYAMVASRSATTDDGVWVNKGDQYGVIGIGGNRSEYVSNTFNSEFFDGGMNYIPPLNENNGNKNNANWDTVKSIYSYLQGRYPGEFKLGWNKDSNLSWFCGGEDTNTPPRSGDALYGVSSVELSLKPQSASSYGVSTGRTGVYKEVYYSLDDPLTVKVGDSVSITFVHDMFSNKKIGKIKWSVAESYPADGGYTLSDDYSGSTSGEEDLIKEKDGFYTSTTSTMHHTDNVTFTTAGEYTFCESLTINDVLVADKPITKVCVKIVVTENIKYYAWSNVGGGGSFESTHKVSEYTTKTMDFGTITTGDSKEIVFSHNIYSSALKNGASWSVDREWTNDDVNSTANLTVPTEEGYVPSVLGYSDGTHSFVLRDVYNFQFDEPGEYEYCETLTLENRKLTRVCAKITVVAPQYAAQSNIAVKYHTFNTTGIFSDTSNAPKTIANITLGDPTKEQVDYDIPYLKVGQTTPLTFSHRIYSSFERTKNNYSWAVKREFNYCTNVNGCEISARINTVNNTGNSGTSSSEINITGNSEWQRALTHEDGSWYKTNDSDMPFRDSGEAGHGFNWRDIYWLKLNKVGDYSGKICESISIPGSNNVLTKACASVKVPYNFKNSTLVKLKSDDHNEVSAGGIVRVDAAKVTVGTKCNEAARENTEAAEKKKKGEYVPCNENSDDEYKYATQVDDATVRLISYSSSTDGGEAIAGYGNYDSNLCYGKANCNIIYNKSGESLNSGNSLSGKTEDVESIKSAVYTVNASVGSYFCVALAVYPYTSGADTNTTTAEVNANNSWYISAPSCARVVKKPTFQVLGGSVYSAGVIKSLTTQKMVVVDNSSTIKAFGSWAEQSVVANGPVVRFASGAAINNGGKPDFCDWQVPLTFANSGCDNDSAGGAAIAANTSGRDAATTYWWLDDPIKNINGWEDGVSNGGSKLKYKYSDGDITFGGMSNISGDATYVIRSENGNIYINGNISYADGPYNTASQIPKMLIYANNIYIKCNVQRIDAILIAKNMINTCAKDDGSLYNNNNSADVNNSNRATTQLKVNGVLMAGQILFDRTYGSDNTPAEIVNYDTSAIIWGREEVTDDIDGSFKVIYQQELAPRY